MFIQVRQMWANKSPSQAHDLLALPDVTVTNAKDKSIFLRKILDMDADVAETVKRWRPSSRCRRSG